MTEGDIQNILSRHLIDKGHSFVIPNVVSMFYSEADLVSVTNSRYLHEYEIKVDYHDFKREIEAVNGDSQSWAKNSKHKHIKARLNGKSQSNYYKVGPAKYWLVVPVGVVDVDEIPEHWGLYEIDEDYEYPDDPVVKSSKPKFIHKDKIDHGIARSLGTNLTKRYWSELEANNEQ